MDEQDLPPTRRDVTPDRVLVDASHPLRGVVLCCTSIPAEKRTELASQAEQMGALHRYDLTSEITHLIVGEYDTPKYRYVAKERPDIKVLTPQWIEAVRLLWIEDQAIDVAATEKEHALPTFANLQICLTGFEDQEQRQRMIDLIVTNGGDYHGDLTKKVTHLIARRPEGAKYKHAKVWGLRVVSVEWLRDSLERGMILEESLFNPEWSDEDRGKDAWNRQKRTSLGKRPFDQSTVGPDEGRRKLRRTASTKLTSENEKIWGDIVGGGGGTIQAAYSGVWETSTEDALKQQMATTIAQQPLPLESSSTTYRAPSEGTFSGCRFYIHGFDQRKTGVLERHLTSHMAEISMSLGDIVSRGGAAGYMVVPHSTAASDVPTIPQSSTGINVVTDWWVERCIEAKSVVSPADYPLGRPFPTFPLPRFAELTICSTGFEGLQLLHLTKAAKLVGAKYEETFSKDASILICNPHRNVRKEKVAFAQEWKLPVVSLDWLIDSIQRGDRQPFKPYIQRQKKAKTEPGNKTSAVEESHRKEELEPEDLKPNIMKHRSTQEARPCEASKLDPTAFADEPSVKVKHEENDSFRTAPTTTSPPEPLNEISANSPRKQSSPSKTFRSLPAAPPALPAIEPTTAISTAITSLLANAKPIAPAKTTTAAAAHHPRPSAEEPTDTTPQPARKKRAPTRILGRAASNVSTASAQLSRASSVDSTASTGGAVLWPSRKPSISNPPANPKPSSNSNSNSISTSSDPHRSASSLAKMSSDLHQAFEAQNADAEARAGAGEDDDAPPQTQMQYEDPESSEHKARVLARVRGEKVVERKERVRVATIGSLDQGGGGTGVVEAAGGRTVRRGRSLRERNPAAGAGGGYR